MDEYVPTQSIRVHGEHGFLAFVEARAYLY